MASSTAPVETKTAASASVGVVTGVITWILVTYVHAFHAGLPGPLAAFLPYIVSVVLASAAGWLAPHTARPDATLAEALKLLDDAGVALPPKT
jgi:hypothetical protein